MDSEKQAVARLRWDINERFLYPGQVIHLGRANENDIVFVDAKISRTHAALEWNGSSFTLRDLGSINGTYVNGSRLAEAARLLRDGDEITISQQTLHYELVRLPADAPGQLLGSTEPFETKRSYLVVRDGPDQGQEYPLWGEVITIGRDSSEATWEVRLSDRSVSRPHARIERRLEGIFLTDLLSANGTQLNGQQIRESMALNDQDEIALGETRLIFHL